MTFTYLDQPALFVGVSDENPRCDLCHQQKPFFDAAGFFGEDKFAFICPDCLSNGRLYERDRYTCQGDVAELKRQLKALHPALSKAALDDVPQKRIQDYADSSNYSTLFYVFKRLHSDQIITLWDSD